MERRIVRFAGAGVLVEHEGPSAGAVVDFLFGPSPPAGDDTAAPRRVFALFPGHGPDRLLLLRDGVPLYEGYGRGVAAELLLAHLTRDLVSESRGGLVLRAAVVGSGRRVLLLPGGSGGGLPGLVLRLAGLGVGYVTSGVVFLPEGRDILQPFRRPLGLDPAAGGNLECALDLAVGAPGILPAAGGDLLHPRILPGGADGDELPLELALFPHRDAGSPASLEELTPARTGQELMQCLLNARNLPGHGFPQVLRAARAVRAFRLGYDGFEDGAAAVMEVLGPRLSGRAEPQSRPDSSGPRSS